MLVCQCCAVTTILANTPRSASTMTPVALDVIDFDLTRLPNVCKFDFGNGVNRSISLDFSHRFGLWVPIGRHWLGMHIMIWSLNGALPLYNTIIAYVLNELCKSLFSRLLPYCTPALVLYCIHCRPTSRIIIRRRLRWVKYFYCSSQHRERKKLFGYTVLPVRNTSIL